MPRTVRIDGEVYRCPPLSAFEQHDLLGIAEPFLTAMVRAGAQPDAGRVTELINAALDAAAALEDDEVDTLFTLCLRDVSYQDEATWRPVYDAEAGAVCDGRDGMDTIRLAVAVAWAHLGPFLIRERFEMDRSEKLPSGYQPAVLPRNRSWLLAPVEHGMLRFESLLDGTVDLSHVALLNEALAVRAENQSRMQRAAEEEAGWRAQSR